MPLAHLGLRLFNIPFPSLILAHVYPDHQEDALGREPMAVFGCQKVECTPECFSSKRSIAEKNPMVVYAPAYSSLRKSGRVVGLVAESRG